MKRVVATVAVLALVLCAAVAVWGAPPTPPPDQQPPVAPGPGPGGPGPMGPGPGAPPTQPRPGAVCPAMALMPPTPLFAHLASVLQITDEQKEKLNTARNKFDEAQRPLRDKCLEATKALRDAMLADEHDAKKTQDLAAAAEKAEAALLAAEIDTWGQIRSILTSAQLAKLRELLSGPIRQPPGGPPARPEPPPPSGPAPVINEPGPPAPAPP